MWFNLVVIFRSISLTQKASCVLSVNVQVVSGSLTPYVLVLTSNRRSGNETI